MLASNCRSRKSSVQAAGPEVSNPAQRSRGGSERSSKQQQGVGVVTHDAAGASRHRQAHLATTQPTAHACSDTLHPKGYAAWMQQRHGPHLSSKHCQLWAELSEMCRSQPTDTGGPDAASHSTLLGSRPPTCKPRPVAALLPALVPAATSLVIHVPAVQVLVLLLLAVVPVVALCLVAALLAPAIALLGRVDVTTRVICRPETKGTRGTRHAEQHETNRPLVRRQSTRLRGTAAAAAAAAAVAAAAVAQRVHDLHLLCSACDAHTDRQIHCPHMPIAAAQ